MAVLCWRRVGCRRLTSFTPARISYISLVCFTRVGAHMSCRRSWRRALRSVQMYGKCVRTYVRPAIFRDRNAPIICVQEHARTFSASYNPNENRRIIRMCRAASERTTHDSCAHGPAAQCKNAAGVRHSGHDARRALGAAACSQAMATRPLSVPSVSHRAHARSAQTNSATPRARARDEQRSACLTVPFHTRTEQRTSYSIYMQISRGRGR